MNKIRLKCLLILALFFVFPACISIFPQSAVISTPTATSSPALTSTPTPTTIPRPTSSPTPLPLVTPFGTGQYIPDDVDRVIDAAVKRGLLKKENFKESRLTEKELDSLKGDIERVEWVKEIEGLEKILLSNYPFYSDIHESGFEVSIYHDQGNIVLLSSSIPLVNGSEEDQKAMIETMMAISEALIPEDDSIGFWVDREWRESWELPYKKDVVNPSEIIRKKKTGGYLVTVWGVAPDIVFLNIVKQ